MSNKDDFLNEFSSRITNIIDKPQRLYFDVDDMYIREVAEYLFNALGCRLSTATAQETYHHVEVLYHFSHDESGQYFCPRVVMKDKSNPSMNAITPIVEGAEWIEREMMDFWGIKFLGHPKPEPLLLGDHPKYEERKNQFRFRSVNHE